MHAQQLAEFAAWIAVNESTITKNFNGRAVDFSETFNAAFSLRSDLWRLALNTFEKELIQETDPVNPWPAIEVVFNEVIVSELLTRIWAATLVSMERAHGQGRQAAIAHDTFVSHIEIRNRILRLMLHFQNEQPLLIQRLNLLRQSVEKWTDVFLALMQDVEAARSFAFDMRRFDDFADERRVETPAESVRRLEILSSSLATALRNRCTRWSANPDLNRRIADSILSCIGNQTFETAYLPPLVNALWREKSHSDAQLLVDRLAQLEA